MPINPFNTQEDIGVPFDRNFNSILSRNHQDISYDHRNYESVDEKNMVHKGSKK